MADVKQDTAKALMSEMYEEDGLTISVEWNEYMLSHEAQVFKQYKDQYGRIGMKLISTGVGQSKELAVANAKKNI